MSDTLTPAAAIRTATFSHAPATTVPTTPAPVPTAPTRPTSPVAPLIEHHSESGLSPETVTMEWRGG